jgi:hypothetical protein
MCRASYKPGVLSTFIAAAYAALSSIGRERQWAASLT